MTYSETYVNLSQRIEWPALRQARIEAAEQQADAAYADLQADSLRLVYEVIRAYTEAAAALEQVTVLDAVTDLFRYADRSSQAMLAEGEASGYSLRRLRLERARYENDLALAELEARSARRRLTLLVLPEGDRSQLAPAGGVGDVPIRVALGRPSNGPSSAGPNSAALARRRLPRKRPCSSPAGSVCRNRR